MRAFQALCVALTAVACRGQLTTYRSSGYSVASVPTAIHASYAPTVISHAAPALLTRTVAVQSAPTLTVSAAPVQQVAISAAPVAQAVNVGVVAAAPAAAVRTHEIHTASGRQSIRLEEFQAGDQVIRVHEAPQAGPQIAQVRVPGERHHVRVVNHQSGPAEVQRVVHRSPTQVVDVQKAGRPGARIVQVVRDESPAPSIEFVNSGGPDHHVYHANDVSSVSHASHAVAVHAAPATLHVASAPTVAVHSSPVYSVAHAPVSHSIVHAPVSHSIVHAPVSHSIVHAPSHIISGASYASSLGRAVDNTVVLHKKA